jgi:hypothetical protein
MWKFQNLMVHTEERGVQRISVHKYVSGTTFTGKTVKEEDRKPEMNLQNNGTPYTDREREKDRFLRFLTNRERAAKDRPKDELYEHGWFHAPTLKPAGKVYYPKGKITGPYSGKATPERLVRLLTLIDYYLNHAGSIQAAFGTHPTLQQYADDFLGVDCNCLVGGYFQEALPHFKMNPSTDIPSFKGKAGAMKRSDVRQMQPLDVLVREGDRHVAVVQDIRPHPDKPGEMLGHIVQSAKSLNGLSDDWFTIKSASPGSKPDEAIRIRVVGYYTFDYAVGYRLGSYAYT